MPDMDYYDQDGNLIVDLRYGVPVQIDFRPLESKRQVHPGMDSFMPVVKFDKKKVLDFLEQIVNQAATTDEDKYKVALDLFLSALEAQDTEFRLQAIINYLGKEYNIPVPIVAEIKIDEIPF